MISELKKITSSSTFNLWVFLCASRSHLGRGWPLLKVIRGRYLRVSGPGNPRGFQGVNRNSRKESQPESLHRFRAMYKNSDDTSWYVWLFFHPQGITYQNTFRPIQIMRIIKTYSKHHSINNHHSTPILHYCPVLTTKLTFCCSFWIFCCWAFRLEGSFGSFTSGSGSGACWRKIGFFEVWSHLIYLGQVALMWGGGMEVPYQRICWLPKWDV